MGEMSLADANMISPKKEETLSSVFDKTSPEMALDEVFVQEDLENRSPDELLSNKVNFNLSDSSSSSSNGVLRTPMVNKKLKKKAQKNRKSPEDVKAAMHLLMKIQLGVTPSKVLSGSSGQPKQMNHLSGISSAAKFHRAFGRLQHGVGQGSSSSSQGSPKVSKKKMQELKEKEDSWGMCALADIEQWKKQPREEMDEGTLRALQELEVLDESVRQHMENAEADESGDPDMSPFGSKYDGSWSLEGKEAKNVPMNDKRKSANELSPYLSFKKSSSSSSNSSDFKDLAAMEPALKREESVIFLNQKPGVMFKQSILNKKIKEEGVSPKHNNSDDTPVVIEGPVVVKQEPESPESSGAEKRGAKRQKQKKGESKIKVPRVQEEAEEGQKEGGQSAVEGKLRRSERIHNNSINISGQGGSLFGYSTPIGAGGFGRGRGGGSGGRGGGSSGRGGGSGGRGGQVGRGGGLGAGAVGRGGGGARGGPVDRGMQRGRGAGRGRVGRGLMCGQCGQQTPRGGAARGTNALTKTQRKAIRKRLQHQFKVRRLRNKLSLATQRYQQRRVRNRVRHNLKMARINLRYAVQQQQAAVVVEEPEEEEDEGEEDMDTTVDSSGSETSSGDSSFLPEEEEVDNQSGSGSSSSGGGEEEMPLGAEAMAGA